jgi:hypothetical protein
MKEEDATGWQKMRTGHLFPRLDWMSSKAVEFSLLCKNDSTEVELVCHMSCIKE